VARTEKFKCRESLVSLKSGMFGSSERGGWTAL
jgi:hypothetical protein